MQELKNKLGIPDIGLSAVDSNRDRANLIKAIVPGGSTVTRMGLVENKTKKPKLLQNKLAARNSLS